MIIKQRFQNDSGAFLNMAIAFADKGDHVKAKEYFKKAIDIDPKIAENYFCFGSYLLEFTMKERIWRFGLTSENIKELKEAENLISKSIDLLKDTEKKGILEDAYINRSNVRMILDDYVHAFEDIDAVLAINPESSSAYANRAKVNTLKKDLDNAIQDFENAIKKGANREDVFPLLITCFLERPDPKIEEAIEIIKRYYTSDEAENNIIPGIFLVECLIKKKSYSEAELILKKLYTKFGRDPKILLSEADLRKNEGNITAFETLSQEARQNSKGAEKNIPEVLLAKHYKSIGSYEKAIPLYESFVSETLFDDILRDYLICLYKSKENRDRNIQKCLTICDNLKKTNQQIPFLLELEAAIYEQMDRLEDALSLYLNLSKLEPYNYRHKLNYAKILIDIGKEISEGERLLLEIKDHISDKDSFLVLAKSFLKAQNYDEAIKQTFKALEIDFSNAEIQLFYVYIFINRKDKISKFLDSDVVKEDFYVKIKKNGQNQEYLISDNVKASITKFELYKDSNLGKAIYGKKVGDKITIKSEFGTTEIIEICEIKSKYVKAFQNILDNFNVYFPDNRAIFKVEASPEKVKELLESSSKRSSKIMDMYLSKSITIGALSAFSGKSLFVCWAALIGKGSKVYCAAGSAIEQKKEQDIISRSSKILIEPIALFTLAYLDILDLPSKCFSEVYVAKASMDELDMEIMDLSKSTEKGLMTLFAQEGKMFRQEISAEDIKKKIEFLQKIRNSTHFKIIGLESPLKDEFIGKDKILGIPYIYSIQICRERTIPLFCDDYFFRELINNEYKVEAFSIQNLLISALQKGLLTEKEYFDKILELGKIGYHYISISANILFYYAEKINFQVRPDETFDTIIKMLVSKETSLESLIAVLTDFMKRIVIEPLPNTVKDYYLDLTLNILCQRGDPSKILKIFAKVLSKKLGLANHLMIGINNKINQWFRANYPVI